MAVYWDRRKGIARSVGRLTQKERRRMTTGPCRPQQVQLAHATKSTETGIQVSLGAIELMLVVCRIVVYSGKSNIGWREEQSGASQGCSNANVTWGSRDMTGICKLPIREGSGGHVGAVSRPPIDGSLRQRHSLLVMLAKARNLLGWGAERRGLE